jgi:paraquat-inducible protein B
VNTESMVSILLGGISFDTPEGKTGFPEANPNTVFTLYQSRDEAQKHAETAQPFLLIFKESVRGLALGAPIDLHGVTVGEVTKIDLALDSMKKQIFIPVTIQLYPDRLRVLNRNHTSGAAQDYRQLLDRLVAHGLRAELKTGSLLTGQLYIALNFAGKGRPGRIDWSNDPPLFPSVPGSMAELQKSLMQIVQKIEKLPLQELAGDARKTIGSLDDTLKSADKLLKNVDSSLIPEARSAVTDARQSLDELNKTLGEARKTLGGANQVLTPDAPIQVDLRDTLREVSRAAQSLRVLGDYLEQHPESLIRGKKEEKQ